MASSDDKIKEIDDKIKKADTKIQEHLKALEGTPAYLGYNNDAAIAKNTGLLLAYTSEKSALVLEKSEHSVYKLHESSKRLEYLTITLFALTLFLACLTVIGMLASWFEKVYGEIAPFVIILMIIFSLIIVKLAFSKIMQNR